MLRSTVPCCLTLASTKHLSLTSTSASFFTMWTCCQKIIAISITAIHHRDICQTPWINFTIGKYLGPVHTNAFSKISVSLSSKTHRSFDAYTTVLMPFRLFKCTKTLENDRITRCDVSWTLCACYKHTHPRYFLVIVFVLRRFRPSALIRYVCVFFFSFSNRRVLNENAQRMYIRRGHKQRIYYMWISIRLWVELPIT